MIGEDQPHVNAPIWGRPPPCKQALTLVFSSMESKSNGPGIGTVFCRLMARMGMNWNLKQLGQLFQVLMLYLQKSTPPPPPKKKFSFNALWRNLFETLFTIIQQHFFIEDITRWREDMNFILEWQNLVYNYTAAFFYRGYYTVARRYEFYSRVAKPCLQLYSSIFL